MKARKILVASIPLLAAAAITGSGFAAWYFGATTAGGYNSFTIQQTATAEAGTITASNSYTVVFDQGHYANRSNAASGIYVFENSSSTWTLDSIESAINNKSLSNSTSVHVENQCTIKAAYSGLQEAAVKNLYNADFDSITFTATLTIGSSLSSYLTFQSTTSGTNTTYPSANIGGEPVSGTYSSSTSTSTLTWTKTVTLAASNVSIPSTSSGGYDSFFEIDATTTGESAQNSLFAYSSTSKPQDASSYNALSSVLADSNLYSTSTDSDGNVVYPNAISLTYTAKLNAHH